MPLQRRKILDQSHANAKAIQIETSSQRTNLKYGAQQDNSRDKLLYTVITSDVDVVPGTRSGSSATRV